ncbi:MAG: 3-hydroxybutyryl-CoA dehydrogenase, partial [Planctomycetes bacterium]|nr:3-hydroxybutyryl-CoA dehydrogenase [Planctomycetota bacterium]
MQIQNVGVVGCGLMGSGIAQIAAQAGMSVHVLEVDDAACNKGRSKIEGFL